MLWVTMTLSYWPMLMEMPFYSQKEKQVCNNYLQRSYDWELACHLLYQQFKLACHWFLDWFLDFFFVLLMLILVTWQQHNTVLIYLMHFLKIKYSLTIVSRKDEDDTILGEMWLNRRGGTGWLTSLSLPTDTDQEPFQAFDFRGKYWRRFIVHLLCKE